MKTYIVGTQWKLLDEMFLMSTTTYVFVEKYKKYPYFFVEKKCLKIHKMIHQNSLIMEIWQNIHKMIWNSHYIELWQNYNKNIQVVSHT